MTARTLQDKIDQHRDVPTMLRNSTALPYVSHPVVQPEFHNWRDESLAWRQSVVLFDQTHHMDALYLRGRDAHRLISETSVTTPTFPVDSAKQYVAVNHQGFLIGDGIIHREGEDEFMYVGRSPAANWLLYNSEKGGYDVDVEVDRRSFEYPLGRGIERKFWRMQIQGPRAWEVIEKINGGPVEQIKFFREAWIDIAGVRARSLRHGMAGAPGLEIWGPYASYLQVREAILEAGREFGIVPVGARAYPVSAVESGWIPSPLPAVYSSEELRGYREWLPADGYEGRLPLAGSFDPGSIEDYYLTPWDLRYGSFVKFDHDFVGRDALAAHDPESFRRKVTFEWNAQDVTRILGSVVDVGGPQYKYLELPLGGYGQSQYDAVLDGAGDLVGLSMLNVALSYNERKVLSTGVVGRDVPEGAELSLVWGEPNGGTAKLNVEHHEQTRVRVIVSPSPYSAVVRSDYQGGWRSSSAVI
ncbi:aminomethyl transferase family protein [Kineococcus sp. LSe6-4]|uniref:Aminomethyl transferase family protein n=1 Tax=Kineococcus halophytocola TaxID=3234027 RepID=A0ABV4GYD7_9ACTN